MILLIRNEFSRRDFLAINKAPYLIAVGGANDVLNYLPYLTLKVPNMDTIKQLRKQFASTLSQADPLHTAEAIRSAFPELFI